MNERIKELMEEAGGYGLPDRDGDRTPALVGKSAGKHAELIVRKCASIAGKAEYSDTWLEPVEDAIKKHFGVEE
jgi:hypothetical protein